ncbi:MAG: hydroxyisourate hydrolase [Nocardioides sp.]|nr:hydroxyisourate hydrolase [Nocardioides sp.]
MTGAGTTLSTHVLDAVLGRPGAGIEVVLTDASGATLGTGTTDDDGRVRFPDPVAGGVHRLTFAVGPWFAAADRDTFYPEVTVAFVVDADQQHYHVPVLLGPYSYTTYRGS